ncbi:hypothetical protein EBS43_08130 [bacterium]|nr:hypothetical protein [bacterium]
MVSSRISAILSEILDLKTNSTPRRVHILGTSCASQAYFLTQTLKTLQETLKPLSTLIILSPDDEQSIELQHYLKFFKETLRDFKLFFAHPQQLSKLLYRQKNLRNTPFCLKRDNRLNPQQY